jgi:hypothetical protein
MTRLASPRGGFCLPGRPQTGSGSGLFEIATAHSFWINAGHRTPTLILVPSMNRSIFYIIGVVVVIVVVLKLLGLF